LNNYTEFDSSKQGTGFGGNLRLDFRLNDRFSVQIEPGLVSRQVKGHVAGFTSYAGLCYYVGSIRVCFYGQYYNPAYDWQSTFRSLDTPLLAKLRLRRGKVVTPYLAAGPTFGLLLSAKYKATDEDGETTSEDIKEDTNSLAVGMCGGLGVEVPVGDKSRVFVEGLYDLGLTGLQKDADDIEPSKHKTIRVNLGIDFRL
jgi:Outer membrane protein beta-barrel domain